MNEYFKCFVKFADFTGRASRKEFWSFFFGNLIARLLLGWLEVATHLTFSYHNATLGYLSSLYLVLVFVPSFSVSARRLHDLGYSGLWLFPFFLLNFFLIIITLYSPLSFHPRWLNIILLIDFVMLIVFGIIFTFKGHSGQNRFGPSPL